MVSAAATLTPLPPASAPLLSAVLHSGAPPACESCQRAPATVTARWPDALFMVCATCAPPLLPWRDGPVRGPLSPAAAPAFAHPSVDRRCSRPAPPAMPPLTDAPCAEQQLLAAAIRTLQGSRPARRGVRADADGSCDVVAALMFAAGGAVDESGRPVGPAERPAARLLHRALCLLADELAGCPPGRSWNDDPIALVDAWQASAALTCFERVAALEAAGRRAAVAGASTTSSTHRGGAR